MCSSNPTDVERVHDMVMTTDQHYEKLLADGHIEAENLENERSKNRLKTDKIFETAQMTRYQLSTGQQRSVYAGDPENLFNAFYELIDFDGGISADDMIRLEAEGRHRMTPASLTL